MSWSDAARMLAFWMGESAMNWFNRLPGSRKCAPGLEWTVLKKLPMILAAGTVLPLAFIVLMKAGALGLGTAAVREAGYAAAGLLLFHWMSTLTVALFCFIVYVMKGHAYVADAYPLPDSEEPL